MKKKIIITSIGILISLSVFGQSFYYLNHDRRWIASFGTGTTSYFGELSNSGDYFDTKLNLNFGLERKLNSKWSVRSEITWYQIAGDDAEADDPGRVNRNLSFKSNNFEINIEGMWGFFREGNRFYQRRKVNPYIFAGIGISYINPKADYEGETYNLRKYLTEDVEYGRVVFVVPSGLGLKFKVHPMFNVNLEAGYRFTFTDYLDDVSTVYIDRSDITDPVRVALIDRSVELGLNPAEPGSKRGNPDADDGYAMFNIKAEFYLPTELLFPPKDQQQGAGKKKYRKLKQ